MIKKKSFLMIFALALILPFAFILTACGGDDGKKVTGIDIVHGAVDIVYGESFGEDPFGTQIIYSDGSKESVDITKELPEGYTLSLIKYVEGSEVEWALTDELSAGNYKITVSYGGASSFAYINVNKAIYQGSASVSIRNMTYGAAMQKPSYSVGINSSDIISVTYSYKDKTLDNSVPYEYTDGAECTIKPGDYQLFAEIETKNYETIRTPLKDFTVSKADVTDYALAIGYYEYNGSDNGVLKLELLGNRPIEMTYDFGKTTVKDYLTSSWYKDSEYYNLYVVKTENGEIALNQNNEYAYVWDVDTDAVDFGTTEVTGSRIYQVDVKFTPDSDCYYSTSIQNVTLKINNLALFELTMDNSQKYAYDGEETTVEIYTSIIKIQDGKLYYSYYSSNEEKNVEFGTITNATATNAGTYTVVATINEDMHDKVTFHNGEYEVTVGTWEITPKSVSLEYDILINNKPIEDYYINYNYTFAKGYSYEFNLSNIQADDENAIYSFDRIELVDPNGNDVTSGLVSANTITIASDVNIDYLVCKLYFKASDSNYVEFCDENTIGSIYLKDKATYSGFTVDITNDTFVEHVKFVEVENGTSESYYILDNDQYRSWADVYNSYYTDTNNTHATTTADANQSYYTFDGSNYTEANLTFYQKTTDYTNEVTILENNSVYYDGISKIINPIINGFDSSDYGTTLKSLEKFNGTEWEVVYDYATSSGSEPNISEIGNYRFTDTINYYYNTVLVDSEGNFIKELVYEVNIIEPTYVTISNYTINFINGNPNSSTTLTGNTISIVGNSPVEVDFEVTLSETCNYVITTNTQDADNEYSSYTPGPTNAGDYRTIVRVVIEDGYLLVDDNNEIIKTIEVLWSIA